MWRDEGTEHFIMIWNVKGWNITLWKLACSSKTCMQFHELAFSYPRFPKFPMVTRSFMSLHAVPRLAFSSNSLHAVSWACIQFHELAFSFIPCIEFHELACSSIYLYAVPRVCMQFLEYQHFSEQLTSQCLYCIVFIVTLAGGGSDAM